MPTPDMTGWPPEYIREYLADQQRTFEADQRTNRALNAIPPDDRAAREQMSPQDQLRYYDAVKRQKTPLSIGRQQYFMPPENNVVGNWPIGMTGSVGNEMERQTVDEQQGDKAIARLGLRINPAALQNFIANQPASTNIEDRRRDPPVDLTPPDREAYWAGVEDKGDPNNPLVRALGYSAIDRRRPRIGRQSY